MLLFYYGDVKEGYRGKLVLLTQYYRIFILVSPLSRTQMEISPLPQLERPGQAQPASSSIPHNTNI
jgi:hypothetical protein